MLPRSFALRRSAQRWRRADKCVGRIWLGSPRVADDSFDYTGCLIEGGLDTPEAAAGEDSGARLREWIGQKQLRQENKSQQDEAFHGELDSA